MSFSLRQTLLAGGIALWLVGVAWGMKRLTDYSFTPGVAGTSGAQWPDAAGSRSAERSTAVIALHPECPCSRATLAELDAILLAAGSELETVLIFVDEDPEYPARDSELFQQARALPRTRLVCDANREALRRFDFHTSGETRLYLPDGRLVFHGGITGSRGHVGDNPGQAAMVAALRGLPADAIAKTTPVFGCEL